ncbi:hypothetical protein ZHAS_00016951 [Anopheles sinensis]|uniref:Uncharacterized protein n=1 Tax=Anopheles sinensis TaxID=74873 RepID=A0A084WFF7_ANOSI|nr:hypothetical protein ZHAS_00016951 [Anopheles sinensis]
MGTVALSLGQGGGGGGAAGDAILIITPRVESLSSGKSVYNPEIRKPANRKPFNVASSPNTGGYLHLLQRVE